MAKVLITGCSSGFGHDAAKALAERGHTVYATMRGVEGKNAAVAEALRSYSEENGVDLHVVELDVTSDASVQAAVERMLGEQGHIDAVVNNAGQMFVGITEAFTNDDLRRQLEINVVGPHRVARAALPSMRARGEGLLINVSSVAGRLALPFFGVYHASKWGLEGMTEALRYELAPFGVDVVIVEPGPFTTNLFPQAPSPSDMERAESYGAVNDTLDGLATAFEGIFEDEEAPTDPSYVVDAFVQLIEAPPEDRPFRTVVGLDFSVREVNARAEETRKAILGELGLGHLEGVVAARDA